MKSPSADPPAERKTLPARSGRTALLGLTTREAIVVAIRVALAGGAAVAIGLASHSPTLVLVAGFVALHTLYAAYDAALHGDADAARPMGRKASHGLVVVLAGLGLLAWGVSRLADSVAGQKVGPGIAFLLMIYVTLVRDGLRERAYRR